MRWERWINWSSGSGPASAQPPARSLRVRISVMDDDQTSPLTRRKKPTISMMIPAMISRWIRIPATLNTRKPKTQAITSRMPMGTKALTIPPLRGDDQLLPRMWHPKRRLATGDCPLSLGYSNHRQHNAGDTIGRVCNPDLPHPDAVALELLHAGLRIDREHGIELGGDDQAQ